MSKTVTHSYGAGALDTQVFAIGDLGVVTVPPGVTATGGGYLEKNVKVFKAGSFKDSRGIQTAWTSEQLATMVTNFDHLKSAGILPKIPVRTDHTQSIKDVCGWFEAVRTDGTFLYADINFTEPEAAAKYKRGTYGPRSLEVGAYEDNNGNKYSPAVLGLAFVDMAAVEGLFGNPHQGGYAQVLIEETRSVPETHPVATFRINGSTDETDPAKVQAHIASVESALAAANATTTFEFRLNGAPTTDFAAVQAHVITLETALNDQIATFRKGWVEGLAKEGKIGAPQIESLVALVNGTETASGMSPEQFTAFQASYAVAPAQTLFSRHYPDPTNLNGAHGTQAASELENTRAVVTMLRRAMDPAEVEKTQAFKHLVVLESATK